MSARRQIIAALSEDSYGGIATLQDVTHAEQLVNALVAEVLAEAPGPENYPGELAMLRGLLGALRVTAKHGAFHEVQQLLTEHERDEQDAYAELGEKATAPAATTTTAQAGATTVSAAGPAFTWPDDWDEHLLAAIREQRGKWTPLRVQQLYVDHYGRGLYRADARRFLSQLAHQGVLRLHDRPTGRHYTLNTRKDVRP